MADYRVRFIGDLGNLGQFNASIRGALAANSRILNQTNSSIVSRNLGAPISTSASTPGFNIRNAITEIDKFNNAIVQSGQVVQRYIQGYTTSLNQATGKYESTPIFGEAYHSDFKKAIANADQYAQVVAKLAPVEQRLQAIQKAGADRAAQIQNAGLAIRDLGTIPRNQRIGPEFDALYKRAFSEITAGLGSKSFKLPTYQLQDIHLDPISGKRLTPDEFQTRQIDQNYITDKALVNVKNADIRTWEDLKRAVVLSGRNIDATFKALDRDLLNIGETAALIPQREAAALTNNPLVRALESKALYAASNPGGYIGEQSARVLAQYPEIRSDLVKKAGLGLQQPYQVGGQLNQNFFQAAEQQQFQVSSVTRDMERNLTQVRGSLIDTNGIMNEFSYAIDKNGNAINTWGRRLSGNRGFLTQTTRDLVKVVEWTVATTVVFGALGATIGSISSINELNLDLQRFAITARLSSDELDGMFKGLGQVAFNTATPISELVKAADDMALATRRANQSSQEWQQSILELANAVGILTNISGLDTVRATDLLVASMKQLSLTTKDLVPLLSQITAAGGGQANAITDITTGLAGLAEAAEQARIPLTGQIAAIQVISQITGKSADQTANAFKNLFGAINAESSIKKLKEFGIAVRDSNGELKPFLEIYKEVADAIRSGEIPQGRVNEILRAISGGRTGRQADAAALLANIYKVFEVQGVVANASNEALIANAKILDTNAAKITRFENAFKISVYEKFNDTIRDMVGVLTDVGTVLAAVFGLFPGPLVTAATEIIALATAFTLLGKAANAIGLAKLFGNLGFGKGGAAAAAGIAGLTGGLKFNPQTPGRNPLISGGLAGLLPEAVLTAQLQKSLSRVATDGIEGAMLSSERTLGQIYASKAVNKNFGDIPTGDLRTAAGLRGTSSTLSPFRQQYDPRYDLPLIGVPSQPYRDLGYNVPRINYIPDTRSQELTRNDVGYSGRDARKLGLPPTPLAFSSFIPGAVLKDADEIGRRIGGSAAPEIKRGILSSVTNSLKGKAGLAAAGAIGGGAAAAAGGADIASLGQLVGGALLFTPAAPLGAGILAGATALQLFQEQQERTKTSAKQLQATLYDLTQQWKQDEAGVRAAQESYNLIQQSIDNLSMDEVNNKTQRYIDLQGQLGEATVTLAIALDTQAGSTKKIVDTIKELSKLSGNEEVGKFAQGIIGQQLNKDQITELVGIVSREILAASGQPVFEPGDFNITPETLSNRPSTNEQITIRGATDASGYGIPEQISPEKFLNNFDLFKQFVPGFNQRAEYREEDFPFQNPLAVQAFRQTAENYRQTLPQDQQDDFITNVINPFNEAVAKFGSAATQLSLAVSNTRAGIEAKKLLGLLSGDEAVIADANIGAAERLQGYVTSPRAAIASYQGRDEQTFGVNRQAANQTIAALQANAQSGIFDPALFKTAADQIIESFGVQIPEGIQKTSAEAKILRDEFGLTDEQIIQAVGSLGTLKTAASEALDEAIAKTKTWRDQAFSDVGQRLVDLQARFQGGEFERTKENPNGPEAYQAELAQLTALQNAIDNTTPKVDSLTEASLLFTQSLGADGAATAATNLIGSLNALQINGFQGVEGSIEAANGALLGLLTRLNLSGPQIAAVVAKWVQVLALAAKAAQIAAAIASMPSPAQLISSGYTGGPTGISTVYSKQAGYQREMDALLRQIKGIIGQGSGTAPLVPRGTTGTTKTGPKSTVDTLYLNEEQQKVADPVSLVKQAYQDALKLQSQIPGEAKRNRLNTVVVFDELQRIFKAKGVSEELHFQRAKGAVKIHLLLDHDGYLPKFAVVTTGKKHDITVACTLEFASGTIVVMNKGYADYAWWVGLNRQGVYLVTRLREDARY